jgi:hypothetical protein
MTSPTHVHTYTDAYLVQRAHCRPEDCDACRLERERAERAAVAAAEADPTVAWDRAETDACERGTPGCSVRHSHPAAPDECQTW